MVDPIEMSRRRRMVYHAVRGHAPEETARRAVDLCDTEFRNEAVFSVQRFVDRLAKSDPAAAAVSGPLFKSLLAARQTRAEDLGPDPHAARPGNGRPAGATAQPVAGAAGWAAVFNRLLAELTGQLENLNPRLLNLLAVQLVEALPLLGGAARQGVSDWVNGRVPRFTDAVPREQMHAVVHAAYLWFCEEFGPVEADRMFARALRACEESPEAAQYPPRGLL